MEWKNFYFFDYKIRIVNRCTNDMCINGRRVVRVGSISLQGNQPYCVDSE